MKLACIFLAVVSLFAADSFITRRNAFISALKPTLDVQALFNARIKPDTYEILGKNRAIDRLEKIETMEALLAAVKEMRAADAKAIKDRVNATTGTLIRIERETLEAAAEKLAARN